MSQERRRHVRAPLSAGVTLFHGDRCLGTFAALNLSAGGVLLAGEGPGDSHGKGVLTAILELPGTRPLRAEAAVAHTRSDWDQATFALHFTRLSASGQDTLQDVVLQTLEEARAASVLIVAPPTGNELLLKRELKKLGRASFHISRPAEAARFFDLQNGVALALIDETLPAANVALLLGLLADHHPAVVRVLTSLRETTGPLPARVEDVLRLPPTPQQLRRVLQLVRRQRRPTLPLDLTTTPPSA